MHIVIDFNPVLRHPYSGFRTYGQGLLGGLLGLEDIGRVTLLAWRRLFDADDFPRDLLDNPKVRLCATAVRPRRWERWWRLVPWPSLQTWIRPFDVYHCMHNMMPPAGGAARVLTVHDLRQYRMTDLYPSSRNGRFERAVRLADRIITYSQSTRRDLAEILRVPLDRIDSSPMGMTGGFSPASEATVRRTLEWLSAKAGHAVGGYVMAAGSPDKRKNIPGVIASFAKALPGLPAGTHLVLAGVMPRDQDIAGMIASAGLGQSAIVTGPLAPELMKDVLASARAMLFLSLYEGFGLPALEAMSCGVPVISSNRSCMPEVVGEAGVLVDPDDTAGIAQALREICSDQRRRDSLSQAGLERSKQFTWERTARDTLECYRRAMRTVIRG